ncbi:flagellar hook protein FlgE [Pararhodobacter sp.]|jgi:flagellar hook protein FlgE|uniref:flagellar hook protein FlgE n=1 Tax=Pararhodobacter sp. TaxID=2127056 RepID=UPI002FDD1DAF
MSTLYSSFNAGISGLNANSTRLSVISDNIANSATAGYKRQNASFQAMILSAGGAGAYMAGGVRSSTMRLIDERGAISSSANPTDLAVGGRGFLPVTTNGQGNTPLMLARTGSFRPDAQGILRNEHGLVLLGWPANPDGSVATYSRDTPGGLQPVQINRTQFNSDPTTQINLRLNLPATATRTGASGDSHDVTLEYFDALGSAESLNMRFTPVIPATGTSNEWTVTITDSASGAVVGEYIMQFDDTPPNAGRMMSITQPAPATGAPYDPVTGELAVTMGSQTISLDIGRLNASDGLTQMASSFTPVSIIKNGSPVQSLLSVQVDPDGMLRGIYDSGLVRAIAQIPLVDVPNPNGLMSLDYQTYRVSEASGPMFLWDAGDGPTGDLLGFSREESATDIANELTNMIQTQRAYSSNAKVIQTVDEMLQETTNIKR